MRFGDLPREETVRGVRVHRIGGGRRELASCRPSEMARYLAAALPAALAVVRRRRPDLNHTHFLFPDGVLALALRRLTGLPYVVTAHGSDVPGHTGRFPMIHRTAAPLWRAVVRGAERVVAPSQRLAELIEASCPGAAVTQIANGVDPARFAAPPSRARRILVVTRMLESKGVQYFLEALLDFPVTHEIHVVGDGPYLEAVRALPAALSGRVHFHGWLDNDHPRLLELYRTSEIFVFPSSVENFPVVLLEAMAAGLAIITTRSTGCEEVVGDTALLVSPRDTLGIRAALLRLTHDPGLCRRLGAAARARVVSRFSWDHVARQYIALYSECLGGGVPPRVPAPAELLDV